MGKKVKKGFKKAFKNPIVGGAIGAIGGGLIGGPIGAIGGGFAGSGGFNFFGGPKEEDVITGGTRLSPPGQQQFDFAQNQLFDAFNAPLPTIGFDSSGLEGSIGRLNNFGPSGATTRALDTLGNFRGTQEAFRTLGALEEFGRAEQGFVTDARNAVLNFDEGFESQVLPLLQQAAEGQFLTEEAGNPFIRDFIDVAQRPVIENFNEEVLPSILSTFSGRGGVGSSLRAAFTAQQARDLQRNLGDISTNISFNVFENERQRQLAAQQTILGFEDAGLNRQLQARTVNLNAAQESARQLLAARQAASVQATQLSQQRLAALQGAASGRIALDDQRLRALQSALGGESNLANLRFQSSQANAAQEAQRRQQLIDFQRNAAIGGTDEFTRTGRAI